MVGSIVKQFTFDAAHLLPSYDGKCKNLHGHRWTVEVEIFGNIDPETRMILDFTFLNSLCKKEVHDKFDHTFLNQSDIYPTAEHLGLWIFATLSLKINNPECFVRSVKIYETPEAWFHVRCEDYSPSNIIQPLPQSIIDYILRETKCTEFNCRVVTSHKV